MAIESSAPHDGMEKMPPVKKAAPERRIRQMAIESSAPHDGMEKMPASAFFPSVTHLRGQPHPLYCPCLR